eukprot:scaffold248362_cov48-Cyclotella_meneghiniana.AAC.1
MSESQRTEWCGYLVGALPTRLDRRVIGCGDTSTYPSTDLVSAPYPGTYPKGQIIRVANPSWVPGWWARVTPTVQPYCVMHTCTVYPSTIYHFCFGDLVGIYR